MNISDLLLPWYKKNRRELPWRDTTNAYNIWLSEIMLQQTRVEQGLPYYLKFLEHFPTVHHLAKASEQEVLTLWQGLGYYSRARNLHETAKHISQNGGEFPASYTELLKLKGIGEYTSAAIASFAYQLPHPVLDGNVYRVIARLYNYEEPVNTTKGKKDISELLNAVFDHHNPADFNQAIMELGALVCTPKNPNCKDCPLQVHCLSFEKGTQNTLPVKEKKLKVKPVTHNYVVFWSKASYFIQKRTEGVWQNLYQFPLIEGKLKSSQLPEEITQLMDSTITEINQAFSTTHLLSHRKITAVFFEVRTETNPHFLKSDIFEIKKEELGSTYPISVLTKKYLDKKEDDK